MSATRRRFAAVAAALLACAALASAAPADRSLLAEDTWWGNVTVRNRCPFPVAIKAGYVRDSASKLDKDHACPREAQQGETSLDNCATDWLSLRPKARGVLTDLPKGLWMMSAYIKGSDPRLYLSNGADNPESYLAPAWNSGGECVNETDPKCVWWGVPALNEESDELVIRCPGYNGTAAPAPAPEIRDVTIVNKCPVAVQVKFAYEMAEGDTGAGCVFDRWYGDEHRCITDWQSFEPEESRFIGQTVNTYWEWGARIADDTSYDLGALGYGAYQGTNETLPCPESDAHGSGYVCEWWAPNCHFCELNATEPLVITCDDYKVALD